MSLGGLPCAAALAHAGVLIEQLLFRSRHGGLLPRTSTDDDPLASMCVNDEEVGTMLTALRAGATSGSAVDPLMARAAGSRQELRHRLADPALAGQALPALVRCFADSDPALDALILVLAPDWDARLARLFGFLNNDLSRQRPTVAHLQLLGIDPVAVLADLVVIDGGLAPLSARAMSARPHVVRLSRSRLPAPALAPSWDTLHFPGPAKDCLRATLARELGRRGADRRLVILEGLPGSGRASAALAAVAALDRPAILRDLKDETEETVEMAIAEAALTARLMDGDLVLRAQGVAALRAASKLARHVERLEIGAVLLLRTGELDGADDELRFTRLPVAKPGAKERFTILRAALEREGVALDDVAVEEVAGRYELTPGRTVEVAHETAIRCANGTARADATVVARRFAILPARG